MAVLGSSNDDCFKDDKYLPKYSVLYYKGEEIRMSNKYGIDMLDSCSEDNVRKMWHFYDEIIDEYLDRNNLDYYCASIIIGQIIRYGIPCGYMPCGEDIYNAADVINIYSGIEAIDCRSY